MNITKYIKNLITPKHLGFNSQGAYYNEGLSQYQSIELNSRHLPLFYDKYSEFESDVSNDEILIEGYGKNPYFFTVIDRLSSIAASLHRDLYNIKSDEIVENEEIEELLKNPNELNSSDDFYYRIHTALRSTGEAFICGIRPVGMGKFTELIVPSPRNVTIYEDGLGMPKLYKVSYFDKDYDFNPADVLHIFRSNIIEDSLYGLSPMSANRLVYKSNNEVWQSEYFLHKNKGVNGILTNDGNRSLTPKEQSELQAEYDKTSIGSNFGKVKVTSQKMRFLQMGANPNDLKSIESRIDHLRQVCSSQNVASQLFGDTSASTYNNMQEAKIAMYEDSILPISKKIDKELSEWLVQGNYGLQDVYIQVDESRIKILSKLNTELSTKILTELQAGVIPIELARHKIYPELFPMPEDLESLLEDDLTDSNQIEDENSEEI